MLRCPSNHLLSFITDALFRRDEPGIGAIGMAPTPGLATFVSFNE
jgi:hypothetical protein